MEIHDTPEIGQLARLDVTWRSSGLWLGPLWAIVCGIVASGGWKWTGATILQAVLLFLLIDLAWASLWAAAVETDWATPAQQWGKSPGVLTFSLPYMQINAPGGRLQRWLAHTLEWWREHLGPAIGSRVSTIVLCLALCAALSAVLGWTAMAISAAGLAVVQAGVIAARGTGRPNPALKATLEIGLAWVISHVILAPLTAPSVVLALAFAAAYATGLALIEGGRRATVWNAAQFAAAAMLVLMRQPVAALAVFFMVIPQLLLEPALRRGVGGAWFVRSAQAWLMLAMFVAAVSIS
jgi:hypothetical protein